MFLGLDLGTTNVKALIVDHGGRVAARASAPVERYCTPGGGVEQDIDEIWQATCDCLRRAAGQVESRTIRAIGISSQGGALQLLDSDEKPVSRVISWLDGRGRPFDRKLVEEVGIDWLIEHLGCNLSSMTLGQMLRLAAQEPRLLAAAAHGEGELLRRPRGHCVVDVNCLEDGGERVVAVRTRATHGQVEVHLSWCPDGDCHELHNVMIRNRLQPGLRPMAYRRQRFGRSRRSRRRGRLPSGCRCHAGT